VNEHLGEEVAEVEHQAVVLVVHVAVVIVGVVVVVDDVLLLLEDLVLSSHQACLMGETAHPARDAGRGPPIPVVVELE